MNAATITRQSKSNLALAFISLGRERKRDMTVFYAFCRVIDDIADSSELSVAEKQKQLAAWREILRNDPRRPLASDVRGLINKYSLPPEMLEESSPRRDGPERLPICYLPGSACLLPPGGQRGRSGEHRVFDIATRAAKNMRSSSDSPCK